MKTRSAYTGISELLNRQAATEAESAMEAIDKLMGDLTRAKKAIKDGMKPFRMINGSMGLVGTAADVERHIHSWLMTEANKYALDNITSKDLQRAAINKEGKDQ